MKSATYQLKWWNGDENILTEQTQVELGNLTNSIKSSFSNFTSSIRKMTKYKSCLCQEKLHTSGWKSWTLVYHPGITLATWGKCTCYSGNIWIKKGKRLICKVHKQNLFKVLLIKLAETVVFYSEYIRLLSIRLLRFVR